jgi:cystathionine beta-lyase
MDFDTFIDRRGTGSTKWDFMETYYGVSPDDGIAMWVADMDFKSPDVITNRLRKEVESGMFGYTNVDAEYRAAICWWMQNRHGWQIEPDWIFTTTGIVNAVGLCLDTFTDPGDEIILFTPVYHAFARAIRAAGREVRELPLKIVEGRFEMDFDAYDSLLSGAEKMIILCSPHNPGGTVWRRDELQALAQFAQAHDLMLVSDEIHHDLVFAGQTHIPMAMAEPSVTDRLVMLTAPSKTFNIAGLHTGNVIIPDDALRQRFANRMTALSLSGNSLGQIALLSAYSPEGAAWVDALMSYLDTNRKIFDKTINAIPGLSSMPLQATYLSWVDFSGTGMEPREFLDRVEKTAKIAVNHGSTFGTGGEYCARFNIGTCRSRVEDACNRLKMAFADLQ